MGYIDSFLRSDTIIDRQTLNLPILNLIDLGLSYIDLQNFNILRVEEAIGRSLYRNDESPGRLIKLDVGWTDNLYIFLGVFDCNDSCSVETDIGAKHRASNIDAAVFTLCHLIDDKSLY